MIAGFDCVDFVVIFDEDDVGRVLTALRPDVHCKGTDYTPETVAIVREAGFDRACTTTPGRVRRTSNYYEMPRFCVRDDNGESFARRMHDWQGL